MNRVGKVLNAAWVGAVIFSAGVSSAFAQSNNSSITLVNPIGTSSFTTVANNVIYFIATTIAIPLTAIMVLVGAFQISTSAGDPEKFSQGRKTIMYAAIGFAIAIVATGVTSIIKNLINGS